MNQPPDDRQPKPRRTASPGPLRRAGSSTGPRQELTREAEAIRRFPIQRRRLGKIISLLPESQYGFIDGEDFRDDIFFHLDVWDAPPAEEGDKDRVQPEIGLWVEFEIDDERFKQQQKLRATVVRPTDRPVGRKLSGRDATFKIVTHHPRARRRRPTWRD